jgi:hypothetical protein
VGTTFASICAKNRTHNHERELGDLASLYVLGARQRKTLLKTEQEQYLYESALILRLDTERAQCEVCVDYQSPPEARASQDSSNVFKSSTLVGDTLYACTSTEVIIFRVPSFERIGYVSLPCFNDLHHVTPTHDGNLAVANTGLDMVVQFTPSGKVIAEWSVLGKDPWTRFSREVDYRKVDSTKPHESHPNFVFELGTDIWVTRFFQRDAICLTSPGKRIDIGGERIHDGLLVGDQIYFTSVDGTVILVNRHTLKVDKVLDLKEIDKEKDVLLGWCRGVFPVGEGLVWVGFTRVRRTKFHENVLWVKHLFHNKEKPTHIALYDLNARKCLQEIDLEQYGMNIVFGVYRAALSAQPSTNIASEELGLAR